LRLATLARYLYLSYFSKPAGDRSLYQAIKQHRPRKILEIGLASTQRTLRMLDFAGRLAEGETLRYSAIDLFEARDKALPKLSLKEVHKELKAAGIQPQLIPGDPAGALARAANSLPETDLILISGANDDAALAAAWFYFPRMMHTNSLVLRQTVDASGQTSLQPVSAETIRQLSSTHRRRAA
jgi:hypothetical protein